MYDLSRYASPNGVPSDYTYGSSDRGLVNASATWDSHMIYGCHCDMHDTKQAYGGPLAIISGVTVDNPKLQGYTGYDCSRRWCPTGDDPETCGGVFEVQNVKCTLTSGTFSLTFRNQETISISYSASASQVAWALGNLTSIGTVTVTLTNSGSPYACGANQNIRVTFTSELGILPLMSSSPSFAINRTVASTKEDVECSNRGFCNHDTGTCTCLDGYASSDGNGNLGTRGDCGAFYEWPKPRAKLISGGGVS